MQNSISNHLKTENVVEITDMFEADMLSDPRVDIHRIDDLPAMPTIANELLSALNDPEIDIDDISDIIIKDPGLTAKLMGLSNSAFFGFNRQVNNLTEAIINVLGLELVKGLSIGIIMGNSFDSKKCNDFDAARYWSNSLLTANLTRNIAKISNFEIDVNPTFFYLYGLLHNLGILVLTECYPNEMSKVFQENEQSPSGLCDIEKRILGLTHHEAGVFLAEKWNLPQDIIVTMKEYSNFEYRDEFYETAQLTGYCSRLVQNWLQGSDIPPKSALIPSLLNLPIEKCEEIIQTTQEKIDDVNTLATTMNK